MNNLLTLSICLLGVYLGFHASTVGLAFYMGVITTGGSLMIGLFDKEE